MGFVFQDPKGPFADEKPQRFPLFSRAKDYRRGLFEYRIVDGSRNRIPIDIERFGKNRNFELQSGDRVRVPGSQGKFVVEVQEDDNLRWLVPFGYQPH